MRLMALRGRSRVSCAQCFDLDSECRCLFIQTPLSYKLNLIILGTFTGQNGTMVEVVSVNKRLRRVENLDELSATISKIEIGEKAERLNDLVVNVADETLKQIFKEEGIRVIYDYLENNHHLKRGEIAEKPKVFSAGLERLMVSGAPLIEKLILKNLYGKLGLKFREKKGYEFSDYIRELEEKCGC